MFETILSEYNLSGNVCDIVPFGTGLINATWKVKTGDKEYIIQRINQSIFRHPQYIAENIENVAAFLSHHFPAYLFVHPLADKRGKSLFFSEHFGCFRLFEFVPQSTAYTVIPSGDLAFEAARQFGMFTKYLCGFDVRTLKITLPDFHNLSLRQHQYKKALENGNPERLNAAKSLIQELGRYQYIVDVYEDILKRPADFKKRVTHHDTKISNVLFNQEGKGLCVIDLDTMMAGYFFSDVGDMLRTYLPPVSEEDGNLEKIIIREDYFSEIVRGYMSQMRAELTPVETAHFVYAGEFMIYMQGLRFLTDYLNNDIYYGAHYESQNLVRALNQITLLEQLVKQKPVLHNIVDSHLATYNKKAQKII